MHARHETSRTTDVESQLKAAGYPTKLISLDGSQEVSASKIFAGIRFFDAYKESPQHEEARLNMACQYSCLQALIERTELNCAIIKNDEIDEENKYHAKEILFADLKKLGDLYWSVGYIHASRILLDIGNYYSKKEEHADLSAIFWQEASTHYFRAKFLLKYDISQQLIEIVYHGKGLEACGFQSMEEADKTMLSHFDNATRAAMQDGEERKVKQLVEKNTRAHAL